jgi:hypothetical protein
MIKFILSIFIILYSNTVNAEFIRGGMDFTHFFSDSAMSYQIPFFQDRADVIIFINQVKWVPEVYKMLRDRWDILYKGGNPGWQYNIKDNPLEYSHQMRLIEGAVSLMNQYRRAQGDSAMRAIWFDSRQDAIRFAQRHKWTESILQIMLKHLQELAHEGYSRDHGWLLPGQTSKDNMYYEQYYRVELACKIMTKYKLHGIKVGDAAMYGTSWWAYSIPWHK